MKYDDASWHYGGDFPADLSPDAGATHIGMFVAWCMLNGLAGELHTGQSSEELDALRDRTITPGQFLINVCDGKFWDQDLNNEGNAFAKAYYEAADDNHGLARYLDDYEATFQEAKPTLYHVKDLWTNYERIAGVLEVRYREWKEGKPFPAMQPDNTVANKPWWKFW